MKLHQTSEETQLWVKNRRKKWWQTTGIGIVVGVVTIIGFRNQLADQLDYFVEAIHGPTKIMELETTIISVTNDIRSIKWHESSVDKSLTEIKHKLGVDDGFSMAVTTTNKPSNIDP